LVKLVAVVTVGKTGAWVSNVNVSAVDALDTLPAASVWRTYTVFEPLAAVKLEAQVVPSVLLLNRRT